jgi:hypothetical protein
MASYSARAGTNADGHHVLHVSRILAPLGEFPTPVVVRSSADLKAPDVSGLSAAARKAHGERAALGGAQKGRILYVAVGRRVLAFLGVHVPPAPGPIICEAFAAVEKATDEQETLMRFHLLAAAQELSTEALGRHGERGEVGWATSEDDVRELLTALGFRPAPKPRHSDCNRPHYLEGTFL